MATKSLPVLKRKKPRNRQMAYELAAIRHLLKQLRERIGKQPESEEAIFKLEVLLGDLTAGSGGML